MFWPDQPEFVRMAARFGATIVPFGVVGEDDIVEVSFISVHIIVSLTFCGKIFPIFPNLAIVHEFSLLLSHDCDNAF